MVEANYEQVKNEYAIDKSNKVREFIVGVYEVDVSQDSDQESIRG